MWNPDNDAIWVDFDSRDEGGALIDTGENSGLVTETENTTVVPGDRVAIAVNFTTWGSEVEAGLSIGPRVDITYNTQWSQHVRLKDAQGNDRPDPNEPGGFLQRPAWHPHAATVREGVWRLSPNLALEAGTAGLSHTLVYQFVVTEKHAILNEGPWLTNEDFYTEADTGTDPGAGFDPRQGGERGRPQWLSPGKQGSRCQLALRRGGWDSSDFQCRDAVEYGRPCRSGAAKVGCERH